MVKFSVGENLRKVKMVKVKQGELLGTSNDSNMKKIIA